MTGGLLGFFSIYLLLLSFLSLLSLLFPLCLALYYFGHQHLKLLCLSWIMLPLTKVGYVREVGSTAQVMLHLVDSPKQIELLVSIFNWHSHLLVCCMQYLRCCSTN